MTDRLQELERIDEIISNDPENAPLEVRRQFWRIVKQIKRDAKPDENEVKKAARIRNVLFRVKRGRTLPLWPSVTLMFLIGALGPTIWYLRLLEVPITDNNMLAWTASDWWVFLRRLGSLMAATFFYYPLGRLIAGKWAGIRIDGMSRGMYVEPTLKIDYESFLLATPAKRKWFFFFSGAWTIITSLALGLVGLLQVGDLSGVVTVFFLTTSEGAAIISGTTKNIGGEMAHFNRERMIERAWRRNHFKATGGQNET